MFLLHHYYYHFARIKFCPLRPFKLTIVLYLNIFCNFNLLTITLIVSCIIIRLLKISFDSFYHFHIRHQFSANLCRRLVSCVLFTELTYRVTVRRSSFLRTTTPLERLLPTFVLGFSKNGLLGRRNIGRRNRR